MLMQAAGSVAGSNSRGRGSTNYGGALQAAVLSRPRPCWVPGKGGKT